METRRLQESSTQAGLDTRGWLSEAICLALAVGVPIIFNPWGGSAFELPKTAFLRAGAILLVAVNLPSLIGRRPSRPSLPPLAWPVLALGAANTLATLFGTDARVSIWGLYERQQGLLTLLAYVIVFFAAAQSLRAPHALGRLRAAIVAGSTPVVAYGILQAMHLDPFAWQTDAESSLLSTLGRSNFVGSYLVILIPLTAWQIIDARAAPGWRRWWPRVLAVAQLVLLGLSGARAAWLGLGVAALIGAIAWMAPARARIAVPSLVLLAALALPPAALAVRDSWPAIERAEGSSVAARLVIWQAALPLVADRAMAGYGPETLRTIFARAYPPQLVYYQGRQASVDRAHNLWLDTALSSGLLGVLALALMLAALARRAHSTWQADPIGWTAIAAAAGAHLADLQFSFDLTATAVVMVFVLALAGRLGGVTTSDGDDDLHQNTNAAAARVLPILAALGLIGIVCVRPMLADFAQWQSQRQTTALPDRMLASANAVAGWPMEPEYHLGYASVLLEAGEPAAADAQFDAAEQLSPGDVHTWITWGALTATWSHGDPARDGLALAAFSRAQALAPTIAGIHNYAGIILTREGQFAAAQAELERAIALDATDYVSYCYLGALYRRSGGEERAVAAYREAVHWGGLTVQQLPCAAR